MKFTSTKALLWAGACLVASAAKGGHAAEPEDTFCGAGADASCKVDPINYLSQKEFTVHTGESFSNGAGDTFHPNVTAWRVGGTSGIAVNNFWLVSASGDVDCSSSFAHLVNPVNNMTHKVQLTNSNSRTCYASWSGLFEDAAQLVDMVGDDTWAVMGMNALGAGAPAEVRFFVERDAETPIEYTHAHANYNIEQFEVTRTASKEATFTIKLSPTGFGQCAEGEYPASVDLTVGACQRPGLALASVDAEGRGTYELTEEDDFFFICATSSSTDPVTGDTVHDMDASVKITNGTLPLSCQAPEDFPEGQGSHEFVVRSSTTLGPIEASTDVLIRDAVVMRVVNYTGVPCNDGRVTAMSQFQAVVETVMVNETLTNATYFPATMGGDIVLERDPAAQYCVDNVAAGTRSCYDTYTSTECLQLEDGTEPDTCLFGFLGELDISAQFVFADANITTAVERVENPLLVEKVLTSCPTVFQRQEDVTFRYPVELVGTAGQSLDDPVLLQLRFLGDSDNEGDSGSVTFAIKNVRVSMSGMTREFDVNDKIALMGSTQSSYHEDVHFCRYEPTPGTCEPFYNASDATRSNAFTLAAPETYHVLNKGFDTCQLNNDRKVDTWVFTPGKWIFGTVGNTQSQTMQVQVVAEVTTCTTEMEAGRRMLQGTEGNTEVVRAEGTIALGSSTVGDGDGNTPSSATSSKATLLLATAAAALGVAAF